MSTSNNIEYSVLKKKKGLHNWGFMPSRKEIDQEVELNEELELDMQNLYAPEILHQNDFGEYYALQDYEE